MLRIRFILIRLRIRPKIKKYERFLTTFFILITQKNDILLYINIEIIYSEGKKVLIMIFYAFKVKKLSNFCNMLFSSDFLMVFNKAEVGSGCLK